MQECRELVNFLLRQEIFRNRISQQSPSRALGCTEERFDYTLPLLGFDNADEV
jgi:hypothetical protein